MSEKKILLVFFLFFLSNCAEKIDPTTGEKVRIEPNPQTKAKEFAEVATALLLAGEISITAAISGGHFVRAHQLFGRKK